MSLARRQAFTLFEVLVTLSVIVFIAGASFASINFRNEAQSLKKGVESLHAMVRIARTQAITNGVHSRLIINCDASDSENYLRQLGVMIEDLAETGFWRAIERGALLPKGVYLVPNGAGATFPDSWPSAAKRSIYKIRNTEADDSAVFHYHYPLKQSVSESDADAPKWIAIQFAPNGRLAPVVWGGAGLPSQNNQLVLGVGAPLTNSVRFTDPQLVAAVSFKLSGATFELSETELADADE